MAKPAQQARRSRRRFRPVSAMLTTAALVLAGLTSVPGTASAAPAPWMGTLGTSPVTAAAESTAGVKVAMMELNWARYEPQPGVFDTGYESEMKWRLASLKAAGMKVTLGLGLHFTPGWVKNMPNSRFVDQDGNVSDEANFVFNNNIRKKANEYLARADAALDLSSFWSVRVNSGSSSEVLYPGGGSYWAFDANARGGAALPPTMADNPLPGWKPGTGGHTVHELALWTIWYISALGDTVRWQASTLRSLGFTGYVEVLTPGVGVYNRKLRSTYYENDMPNGVLGLGAAWGVLYWKLADVPNLVANITSTADGSGGNDGCEAADRDEPIHGDEHRLVGRRPLDQPGRRRVRHPQGGREPRLHLEQRLVLRRHRCQRHDGRRHAGRQELWLLRRLLGARRPVLQRHPAAGRTHPLCAGQCRSARQRIGRLTHPPRVIGFSQQRAAPLPTNPNWFHRVVEQRSGLFTVGDDRSSNVADLRPGARVVHPGATPSKQHAFANPPPLAGSLAGGSRRR